MRRLSLYIVVSMLCGSMLWGKGVAAGTTITNTAQLSYKMNGSLILTQSNSNTITVDQVISLNMVCQNTGPVDVQKGENQRALTLLLSNTGNGKDHYNLSFDTNSSATDVSNRQIWLDDGDGVFNAASDTQISDINLTADSNATLFFVSDIPANASWSDTNHGIRAESDIVPGTTPGSAVNLGSYYAVNGTDGGVDSALCSYHLVDVSLQLDKNATLSSPHLYIGTTIHYTIKASVVGIGTLKDVSITDAIPTGTTYVANSLKLDGTLLNNDALYVVADSVVVYLGNMTQTASAHPVHLLEFDVVVQ